MSPALNRLLLRVGRWPRRFAVLVCVVLGVSEAAQSHSGSPAAASDPLAKLAPSQVAVPVTLDQAGTDGLLEPGKRIGLLASVPAELGSSGQPTSRLVADHLLVLRVSGVPPGERGSTSILVAADRPTALRIAEVSGQTVLAVVDKSP